MLERLLEEGRPLIAVHRGKNGGAIAENTVYSALNGFRSGADIVEFDVQGTLDGKIAVFHEGMEFKILSPALPPVMLSLMSELKRRKFRAQYCGKLKYGIFELEEYLLALKGKGLLNFDRIWCADIGKCLEVVKKLDMFDQILFKGYATKGRCKILDYMKLYPEAWFMPICKTNAMYDTAIGECARRGVVARGIEVLYKSEDDMFASSEFVSEERKAGRFVWANSIDLDGKPDMCAEHGDMYAMFDGYEKHWGFLSERGYRVIQTDWPDALKEYLDEKFPEQNKVLR